MPLLSVLFYLFFGMRKLFNSSQIQDGVQSNPMDPAGKVTMRLTDRLAVRLYADCRPNFLETKSLQKGLVLALDGKELIEEGVGFGVPIVKYRDKTFFSSKAEVSIAKNRSAVTLKKVYTLDTISLKKFGQSGYINDAIYSSMRKTFEILYLRHKKLLPLFNKTMEFRDLANIKTEFVSVRPRGKVCVTYSCQPSAISVQVDYSGVDLNKCEEILVLNEQGSGVFQKYIDSNGLILQSSKIGAWEKVMADNASLFGSKGEISFGVRKVAGAEIFRGWEQTKKRFSWAGLSYRMRPNNGFFSYSVRLSVEKN